MTRIGSRPAQARPAREGKPSPRLALFALAAAGVGLWPQLLRAEAQAGASTSCLGKAKPMARLELLFGASFRGGSVGRRAFARFLKEVVTPRFPDGLSVFEGYGEWRSPAGTMHREATRMLLVWYEPDSESDAKIEEIRAAYKKRFGQESVLRSDGASCVSF